MHVGASPLHQSKMLLMLLVVCAWAAEQELTGLCAGVSLECHSWVTSMTVKTRQTLWGFCLHHEDRRPLNAPYLDLMLPSSAVTLKQLHCETWFNERLLHCHETECPKPQVQGQMLSGSLLCAARWVFVRNLNTWVFLSVRSRQTCFHQVQPFFF